MSQDQTDRGVSGRRKGKKGVLTNENGFLLYVIGTIRRLIKFTVMLQKISKFGRLACTCPLSSSSLFFFLRLPRLLHLPSDSAVFPFFFFFFVFFVVVFVFVFFFLSFVVFFFLRSLGRRERKKKDINCFVFCIFFFFFSFSLSKNKQPPSQQPQLLLPATAKEETPRCIITTHSQSVSL